MSIILIGMKGCGKTTIGTSLAEKLQVPFIDVDTEIEKTHRRETGEALSFRQIFKNYGAEYFCALETRTLQHIAKECGSMDFVFACGGQTPLRKENQEILAALGKIIFLQVEMDVLLKRILAQGIPAFFPYQDDPERSLNELLAERLPTYKNLAAMTLDAGAGSANEVTLAILREIRSDDQH
jgi:shikimate kinase